MTINHILRKVASLGLLLCGIGLGVLIQHTVATQPVQGQPAHASETNTSPEPPAPEPNGEVAPDYEEPLEKWLLPEYNFNETDLAKFNGWVEAALADSRTYKNKVVIIDKSAYKLFLVQSGEITLAYPIELGFDAVHDKRVEGDGCTPEGVYRTTDKRDVGQTVFHRAFLINYPNDTDRKEFKAAKAAGEIPADATIGGGIMIHGIGSGEAGNAGGSNWTLGCISLSDEDIDELFPLVSDNTRVVIVRYTDVDLLQ